MATVSIFYGSVYGNAQNVAQEVASHLGDKGGDVNLVEEPTVNDFVNADAILVISSTTGQGDIPPNLEWAIADLAEQAPSLAGKPFAVAALGDSSYGDSYCGAGKQIFELLSRLSAKAAAQLLEVDGIEIFEPEEMVTQWVSSLKLV